MLEMRGDRQKQAQMLIKLDYEQSYLNFPEELKYIKI